MSGHYPIQSSNPEDSRSYSSKYTIRRTIIAIVIIAVIAAIMSLAYFLGKEESFLPHKSHSGTWEDWDNYAKTYGNTRAYWGRYSPGGGWEGSPYSPENNPGGVLATGGVSLYGHAAPPQTTARHVNLAHATNEDLDYLYKSQLMY
jgi:uncharacterized membrane protein